MEKEIKKMIEENPIALATISNEGKPHNIAVGDVKVVSDNQILIGDNYMKETILNINNNKNVALLVFDSQQGFELKGIAEYFKEGGWLEQVKMIHKGYPAKGAILVTINEIKECG